MSNPNDSRYVAFMEGLTKLVNETHLQPGTNQEGNLCLYDYTQTSPFGSPMERPFPVWDDEAKEYVTRQEKERRYAERLRKAREARQRALYEKLKAKFESKASKRQV